jgi:hypothetical protein
LFGACAIIVNMTSYKRPLTKEEEQIQKLKAFSNGNKERPAPDPLESDQYVAQRNRIMMSKGVVPILDLIAKSASENTRVMLAQAFLNLTTEKENRGKMAQEGFSTLLNLCRKGPASRMTCAVQALSKIVITTNPVLIFKGNTAIECIVPLLNQLKTEDGLMQFEALLALTNIASLEADDPRMKIVSSGGLESLESFLLHDHKLLRRAALELLCNLMFEESVFERYCEKKDRLFLIVALTNVDDFETQRAASGILAILSSAAQGSKALFANEKTMDRIHDCVMHSNMEIVHRGLECVRNCLKFCKEKKSVILNDILIRRIQQLKNQPGPIQSAAMEILKQA